MPSRTIFVPDYIDADSDTATYGPDHVSYSNRSVELQQLGVRLTEIIQEIEADGNYVGESHPLEQELQHLITSLPEKLAWLQRRGRSARVAANVADPDPAMNRPELPTTYHQGLSPEKKGSA